MEFYEKLDLKEKSILEDEVKEAYNHQLDIKKYVDEMDEEYRRIQNKKAIDDIFAISNGQYKTYEMYLDEKRKQIEDVSENNRKPLISGLCLKFTYYVKPIILDKDVFNYILNKFGERK